MSSKSKRDQHRARSISRLAAVQALYQIDILKAQPQQIIDDMKLHRLSEPEEGETRPHDELEEIPYTEAHIGFFDKVMHAVLDNSIEVDDALNAKMREGWSLDRVDANLRAIMRCAAGELVALDNVPAKVVLTEYVDIADAFFGNKEKQFLSGLLNAVARALRPEEFQE